MDRLLLLYPGVAPQWSEDHSSARRRLRDPPQPEGEGGKASLWLKAGALGKRYCTFMHWKRKWQPTSVFLLGESQGQGSLEGCRLWGRTELDTTEVT